MLFLYQPTSKNHTQGSNTTSRIWIEMVYTSMDNLGSAANACDRTVKDHFTCDKMPISISFSEVRKDAEM
jgi:hypothetical protein